MSHLSSTCFYSTLNPQVILCDGPKRHFYDRSLNILWIHHMQDFILKLGESVHNRPNNNGPNLNLKNIYGNTRINQMRKYGALKFMTDHKNAILLKHGNISNFRPLPSPRIISRGHTYPLFPLLTKTQTTKIALQIIKHQRLRKRTRQNQQQSPSLRLKIWNKSGRPTQYSP